MINKRILTATIGLQIAIACSSSAASMKNSKLSMIQKSFDSIKGCYWMVEDLTDPEFRQYPNDKRLPPCKDAFCKEMRAKHPRIASTISGINDSNTLFDPIAKKPLKEVYVSLLPHNSSPGISFQLVISEES
jgi:hypothetical protein